MTGFVATATAAPVIVVRADGIALPIERAIPIALITSELLVNAVKYGCNAAGACRISVSLTRSGVHLVLAVRDEGPGFPEGFDPAATDSLGMQLIHVLAQQLGAELTIRSTGDGPRGDFAGGTAPRYRARPRCRNRARCRIRRDCDPDDARRYRGARGRNRPHG